jgi:centriolar protein POC1
MAEFKATEIDSFMNPCLERTFRGHKNYVTSTSFSPNLTKLASGSADNTVMMWNFKPQLRAFRYIGHTEKINDVQFSPSGDVLASASKDRTVRLWIPSA